VATACLPRTKTQHQILKEKIFFATGIEFELEQNTIPKIEPNLKRLNQSVPMAMQRGERPSHPTRARVREPKPVSIDATSPTVIPQEFRE